MNNITIYTDGACRGNQSGNNIGANAFYMRFGDHEMISAKFRENTTNNIMEMTAVIEALKHIKRPCKYPIYIYSDSQYVVSGCTTWRYGWEKKKFSGVKNASLWKELFRLIDEFPQIHFIKVKGHSGDWGNEQADLLCNLCMDERKNIFERR